MRSDLLVSVTGNRAGDARAILLPFSLAHTVLGIILAWSPAGLEDSSVQLAIAAWTVLGSLWSAMTMDGVWLTLVQEQKTWMKKWQTVTLVATGQKFHLGLYGLSVW